MSRGLGDQSRRVAVPQATNAIRTSCCSLNLSVGMLSGLACLSKSSKIRRLDVSFGSILLHRSQPHYDAYFPIKSALCELQN